MSARAAGHAEHRLWGLGGVSERFSCKMGTLGSTGLRVLFPFFLKFPKSFLSLFLPPHSRGSHFRWFFFFFFWLGWFAARWLWSGCRGSSLVSRRRLLLLQSPGSGRVGSVVVVNGLSCPTA